MSLGDEMTFILELLSELIEDLLLLIGEVTNAPRQWFIRRHSTNLALIEGRIGEWSNGLGALRRKAALGTDIERTVTYNKKRRLLTCIVGNATFRS